MLYGLGPVVGIASCKAVHEPGQGPACFVAQQRNALGVMTTNADRLDGVHGRCNCGFEYASAD
jgi:hypothetical protein